eukprot:gene124-188_t
MSSSEIPDWVSKIFCPALGMVIANVMFATPLMAVLEARKKQDLSALNPLPWCIIAINCFGWSMYGCLMGDYFVFWSNFPAIALSLFFCLSALRLLTIRGDKGDADSVRIMEGLLIGGTAFWGVISMVAGISLSNQHETAAKLVGYSSCIATVIYYAAPLSTIKTVIQTRDSSSLFLPMILTNQVNATLWVIYGLAMSDPIIWAPNLLGFFFAIFQICICLFYKKWNTNGTWNVFAQSQNLRALLLSQASSSSSPEGNANTESRLAED